MKILGCLFIPNMWTTPVPVNVKYLVEVILVKDALWHKTASDLCSFSSSGLLTAVTTPILGWTETFAHSCPTCQLPQKIFQDLSCIADGERLTEKLQIAITM